MEKKTPYLHCTVVTPEAQIFDAEVADVVLPAHDGLVGILPDHAPLLCNLGAGLLRYTDSDKQRHTVYIEEGFGHVRNNEVTILTRRALTPDDITGSQAGEQLQQAQSLPRTTIEEVETRTAAMQHAKHLLAMTQGK
jgi:F-type H+-transporting ATPase subunit epsilon